ncbi:DUF3574 domain-containing protein [Kribbella sp. NPDC051587]|uniref:DUF3574 domain-containing protein n=1 Tax=Kribbella sp. NPDC051587 TaxID=3364119 RepID=UPI003789EAF6
MKHLGKTAATAALVLTALATPAAVALQADGAEDSSKKIEEIRGLYEKKFQQESVLRADSTEHVSF